MFQRVADFHDKFGLYISKSPEFPDEKIRNLRRALLAEEVNEFAEAYNTDDLVGMADALADIGYIIAGSCISYGIAPDGPYESPFNGFNKMDIFLVTRLDNLLTEMLERYENAEKQNDLQEVRNSLTDLLNHIFGIAVQLGIPFNLVFTEVHRSNMSKLDENGRPIHRADGKVLKSNLYTPPNIRDIIYPNK